MRTLGGTFLALLLQAEDVGLPEGSGFDIVTLIANAPLLSKAVLSSLAVVTARTAHQTRLLAQEVSVLEGLLPICSHCKKIRDENDEWQRLERYITQRSAAQFTHGVCPECRATHYRPQG